MLKDYQLLKIVSKPEDLKGFDMPGLIALASELREFLLESVSETGGHLSSGLGVVELTIALHYCFDAPRDKIIWDVGHQAYAHKILTGRMGRFDTLRKHGGLSGFPKSSESEYDAFETGHSSTSISAAYGFAVARDIQGSDEHVIAVIGDGAMTGGLAYEALNNAGRQNTNLIIILNDNGMSIGKNVGALSKHLIELRTQRAYLSTKKGFKDFLKHLPVGGDKLDRFITRVKKALKYLLLHRENVDSMFEGLGVKYIGPLDGHDLPGLCRVISRAKNISGPVLLHVYTKKGKGYDKAENAPNDFHGVAAFDIASGTPKIKPDPNPCANSFSERFGRSLSVLAESNKKIVAVTAAMPDGTGLGAFRQKFPERLFDVGIAEGHAVTFCAGLAKAGLLPVFAVYSTFLQRGYDQLLHDVCLQNLHVVFAIDRAGVVGPDGETHQGLYDLSYLLHMPNMTVLCPKDLDELDAMLDFAVKQHSGPVAIRYPRRRSGITLPEKPAVIELCKSERILEGDGKKAAVISIGVMTGYAYKACEKLAEDGIKPALYNARFAKPLDIDMINAAAGYEHVFTVEDNTVSGGFGSSVMAALDGRNVHILGFPDKFIEHGSREELISMYGLDADGIYKSITERINRQAAEDMND